MLRTGIEDWYVIKDNQKLRYGYTTGTCAAAAAKAAALMLLSGERTDTVTLMTPRGVRLDLPVTDVCGLGDGDSRQGIDGRGGSRSCGSRRRTVSCAVVKDGGDDPDVTNGIRIYAAVTRSRTPGIHVDGGEGVGRVTRKGLSRQVGEAAINPVPLRMITDEVTAVAESFAFEGGLDVLIFVPEGARIAKQTFNPRLGIEGGISILGTTGIEEPMSERALLESIRLEMRMLVENGHERLILVPGNYGRVFAEETLRLSPSGMLKFGNFVGAVLDMAQDLKVREVLFVAHLGKFIKVAGGIMQTHSKEADCRAELMAAFALRAGADRETAVRLLETATTDEALEILDWAGIRDETLHLAAESIGKSLQRRTAGAVRAEAVIFSSKYGLLAQTEGAGEMVRKLRAPGKRLRTSPGKSRRGPGRGNGRRRARREKKGKDTGRDRRI